MLMWLLWLYLADETLVADLAPFTEPPTELSRLDVAVDGFAVIGTEHELRGYDAQGNLAVRYPIQAGSQLLTAAIQGDYLYLGIIALSNYRGEVRILSRAGELLQTMDTGVFQFMKTQQDMYIWHYQNGALAFGGPYPYRYAALTHQRTAAGAVEFTIDSQRFGKVTPQQVALRYNERLSWLVKRADMVLGVNEVEAQVYLHTSEDRRSEAKSGEQDPPTTPTRALPLPGANMLTSLPPFERVLYKEAEFDRRHWNWEQHHTRIRGFYARGSGYLVLYTYPVCAREPADTRLCEPAKLAILALDEAFQPQGEPVFSQGIPLGVRGDDHLLLLRLPTATGYPALDGAGPFAAALFTLSLAKALP